jgi:hypothetical protein
MIKEGTILIAKNECEIKRNGTGKALIIGKEYIVHYVNDTDLIIESEFDKNHLFGLKEKDPQYWGNYFDLKQF